MNLRAYVFVTACLAYSSSQLDSTARPSRRKGTHPVGYSEQPRRETAQWRRTGIASWLLRVCKSFRRWLLIALPEDRRGQRSGNGYTGHFFLAYVATPLRFLTAYTAQQMHPWDVDTVFNTTTPLNRGVYAADTY